MQPRARAPYPGLRSFRRDEADIFFGRDEQICELVERLRSDRLLAIAGDSGCGKSSLVRAGLIPTLEAGIMANARRWQFIDMRPGNRPVHNLASLAALAGALSSGRAPRVGRARGPRNVTPRRA
jgi:hypothetical protein